MKLIEFEGCDGSGKSTGLNYVGSLLESMGKKVLYTQEVGNPYIEAAVLMRRFVLDPNRSLSGTEMEVVFAAMRVMNQAFYRELSGYDYILSDRGYLSHLAYTDHNVSKEFTHAFYTELVGPATKLPDSVIYFRISPETGLARRTKRGTSDAIEMKGSEFQVKVGQSFETYLETVDIKEKFIVDANQNLEGVQKQLAKIAEIL